MFKLNIHFISIFNRMSLSKRNLSKLNAFKKKNNSVNNNTSSQNTKESDNSHKVEDPSKIFYSIIDNSDNINETLESIQLLKKSEDSLRNINFSNTNTTKNLSIEDQLYDEFNYLLDE